MDISILDWEIVEIEYLEQNSKNEAGLSSAFFITINLFELLWLLLYNLKQN